METINAKIVQIDNATLDDIKNLIDDAIDRKLNKLKIITGDGETRTARKNRMLSRKEVMEITSLSNSALYNRTKDGTIRHRKVGGRVLFLESELWEDLNRGVAI